MRTTKEFEKGIKMLNLSQKQAVDTINGPLNLIANAGSGKTTIVALRCCNILEKTDFSPSNILCLTFSNAGVNSMKKKLHELIGATAEQINVSTFHAFALDVLQLNDDKSNISNKSLITPGQRMMILEKLINNADLAGSFYDIKPPSSKKLHSLHKIFNVFKKEYITKEDLISYCNRCLESILPYEEEYVTKKGVLNAKGKNLANKIENFGRYISNMYESYQHILDDKAKFEFIDMLTEAIYILQNKPSIRLKLQEQYQYIMVDEFQDTNSAMLVLISLLVKDVEQPNIAIVGDESQTIYRFNGANLKNYEWINNLLPGMKTIVLDTNYRSTVPILNKSYEVISQSNNIHPLKKSPLKMGGVVLDKWNEIQPFVTSYEESEQEGYFTALSILEMVKGLGEEETVAVLSRKNDDLKSVKAWLDYFGIDSQSSVQRVGLFDNLYGKANYYTLSILKYLDKDEKQADAYFCNLLIESGYKKEVGYAYLLFKKLKPGLSFIQWLLNSNDVKIETLKNIALDLCELEQLKHNAINHELNGRLFAFILKTTKQYPKIWITSVWDDFVRQFIDTDKTKSFESLCELLDYYHYHKLNIDVEDRTPIQSKVILSTIHGSKGLEYDYVFVIGLESENFENKKEVYDAINIPKLLNRFINTDAEDLEDYRRLLYVAMTRAKKTLQMSYRRVSYSRKQQQITTLLKNQVENGSLRLIHEDFQVLPTKKADKTYLELEDDFRLLVNEKLQEFHISASSTNNWEQCQNRFFYYNICKIPSLPSVPTSFGQFVHAVLQKVVVDNKLQPTKQEIADFVEEVFISFQNDFHPLHRFIYKRYAKELIGNYLGENPILKMPAHTESYLNRTLDNEVRINGYLDRVDLVNDSTLHIIDYKTNKYAELPQPFVDFDNPGSLYWRQGKLYSLLVKHHYGEDKDVLMSFHYITQNKQMKFVDVQSCGFEDWLLDMWKDVQTLNLTKTCNDSSCIYCKKSVDV